MPIGSEEINPSTQNLKPHIDLFRLNIQKQVEVPLKFQDQSRALFEGIYPQDLIRHMQKDGYNPIIIGYDHPQDNKDLLSIKNKLTLLKKSNRGKTLKIAHEIIPPIQLDWIKDFLAVTKEYRTKGTMHGKVPDHIPEDPEVYKAKLNRNHAENLALWMLEQGFKVIPLDSSDTEKWMKDDSDISYGDTRQALTAIKRDTYGLEVMNRERPDIITTGSAHALKYDLLLERNGDNSHYYFESLGDWNDILSLWEDAHRLYKNPNTQYGGSRRSSYQRGPFEEED